MKTKVSKAQIEVWEWKEIVSNEMNKIPRKERIKYLFKKAEDIIKQLNLPVENNSSTLVHH